jgi:hypothetical protein
MLAAHLVVACNKLGNSVQYCLPREDFRASDERLVQRRLRLFLYTLLHSLFFLCLCELWRDRVVIDRYVVVLTSLFIYLIVLSTVLA